MTSERDVYRSANLYLKRYGSAAHVEAAKRADELMAKGDMEGRSVWLRVVAAILELRRNADPVFDRVH